MTAKHKHSSKQVKAGKFVRLGPFELEVQPDQDVADELSGNDHIRVVCARLKDGVKLPGSAVIKAPCCGHDILVSETTQKLIAASPDQAVATSRLICLDCAKQALPEIVKRGERINLVTTPTQVAERDKNKKALGLED